MTHKKDNASYKPINRKIILVAITLIALYVFLFLGGYAQSINTGQIQTNDFIESKCVDVQVPYESQEEYVKIEYYTENVPYTDNECKLVSAIYKTEWYNNYNKCIQEECASYNSICVEKNWLNSCVKFEQQCAENKCVKYQQYCGIKINNEERDGINFDFNLGKYNNDVQISSVIKKFNVYVPPLESRIETWDFTYLPTDSVSCWYNPENMPQRQECRDVIKYKDVQKSREVTAYKPVTKYRTEQRCN